MANFGNNWDFGSGSVLSPDTTPTTTSSESGGVGAGAANPFMIFATLASGYMQSSAMRTQGQYTREVYEMNADLTRLQAQDAIRRGEVDAKRYKQKVRQMLGSQRAAMAAQGIDVSGMDSSAAEIQKQTLEYGMQDVQTIRNNAFRQAWGLKVQATQYEAGGASAQLEANSKANNTLLSAGIQAAEYGIRTYKDRKAGSK